MSESGGGAAARPRQVTLAGLVALSGCVLLVFSMLDSMARVRSVDMRESVTRLLSTPPGSGLGMDADAVIDVLRGVVFFSGALAAAGAVLAFYTLQRHRGARIGLTITAVLMLFSATFVSGFLPVIVAVAATMLWGKESRDWFESGSPRTDPDGSARPVRRADDDAPSTSGAAWPPPLPQQPDPQPQPQPQAQPPQAQPTGQYPYPQPAPYAQPPGAWSYPAPPRPGRPVSVTVAAWLTWGFSALTLMFFGLVVITLVAQQSALVEELKSNPEVTARGYSTQQLLGFLWAMSAVGIVWSLAAIALAVLAFRRVNIGRIGLVVSAAVSGILGLLTLVGIVHAVAAFTTIGLLFAGGANRWYAEGGSQRSGGSDDPFGPSSSPPPPSWGQPPSGQDKPPVW